jgi:hypothetical protein
VETAESKMKLPATRALSIVDYDPMHALFRQVLSQDHVYDTIFGQLLHQDDHDGHQAVFAYDIDDMPDLVEDNEEENDDMPDLVEDNEEEMPEPAA